MNKDDILEIKRDLFDYLPIEAGNENLYIQHLWGAFEAIIEKDEPVRAFAVFPFHLLFMLAVQYKVYRLSAFNKAEYLKKLVDCDIHKINKKVLEDNPPIEISGIISSLSSVRNLSLIKEKKLFDFFDIVEVDKKLIEEAKNLVEVRGTYAHANGNIEKDIGSRIKQYLKILESIQSKFKKINQGIQNWCVEVENNSSSAEIFLQERFLYSQFSPRDFGDVIDDLLAAKRIQKDKWIEIINKGLELSYDKTIKILYDIASNHNNIHRKRAISILKENGEEI